MRIRGKHYQAILIPDENTWIQNLINRLINPKKSIAEKRLSLMTADQEKKMGYLEFFDRYVRPYRVTK